MEFTLYKLRRKGLLSATYFIENDINSLLYTIKKKSFFSSTYLFIDHREDLVLRVSRASGMFKMGFEIFNGLGEKMAHITKKGFKNDLSAEFPEGELFISGNYGRSSYTFTMNNHEVAKVSRKKHSMLPKVGIAIESKQDQLLILGMVIAIEMKIQYQNAAASG